MKKILLCMLLMFCVTLCGCISSSENETKNDEVHIEGSRVEFYVLSPDAFKSDEDGIHLNGTIEGEVKELTFTKDTDLFNTEFLDSFEEGDDAISWLSRLKEKNDDTSLMGVYDLDLLQDGEVKAVFGLYWWD